MTDLTDEQVAASVRRYLPDDIQELVTDQQCVEAVGRYRGTLDGGARGAAAVRLVFGLRP